tara:strand:- start:49 stop:480 length:432 start_codon:yes stop_codon:yes gene_type:complete
MAFKLGKEKDNYAINGEIKKKMRFGKESGDPDVSIPGVPIIRKKLQTGVMGEANMDGSIYISDELTPGSYDERQVIIHEMRHATDIKIGKLTYDDDHIMYNGKKYPRKDVNGIDSILVEGQWKEAGTDDFPWEVDANNGDNKM